MFRKLALFLVTGTAVAAAAPELADPTRPPAGYETTEGRPAQGDALPKLTAIKIGGGSRVAIVDGTAATAGDIVGGYRIVAVEAGRITLQRNGAEVELPLLAGIKKISRKAHK